MSKIKIVIADDYQVFREGLALILSFDDQFEIIAEAENGKELLKKMETKLPDLVILDYKMPVMDGLAATKTIKEKYPLVKVLIISMYEDEKFNASFSKSGADGYLLKNADPDVIRSKIHEIINKHSN